MPQQMTRNGDVRVIPDALVKKYKDRGWEPTSSKTADPAPKEK